MTINMNSDAFVDALKYYRDSGEPFTVTRTGYTAAIKTEGGKFLFADSPIRPQLFGLSTRLKKEVAASGIPNVDERNVRYYSFRDVMRRKKLPTEAVSIDLTAAYIHALKRIGLISPKMFDELRALNKPDRLKVVGMLATTRTVIVYADGRIQEARIENSPTRGAFFAACAEVGRVMHHVSQTPGHLFYWVDGAFFDKERPEVVRYLRSEGYPSKTEHVQDMKFSPSRKVLFYSKDGSRKYLCLPSKKPSPAWIADLLNTPQK